MKHKILWVFILWIFLISLIETFTVEPLVSMIGISYESLVTLIDLSAIISIILFALSCIFISIICEICEKKTDLNLSAETFCDNLKNENEQLKEALKTIASENKDLQALIVHLNKNMYLKN